MDQDHPHRETLKQLLSTNVTMDEVFKRLCIPVLLTYDSATVGSHNRTNEAYENAIKAEFDRHHKRFCSARLPDEIKIILILLPMNNKAKLLERFDAKLKGMMT